MIVQTAGLVHGPVVEVGAEFRVRGLTASVVALTYQYYERRTAIRAMYDREPRNLTEALLLPAQLAYLQPNQLSSLLDEVNPKHAERTRVRIHGRRVFDCRLRGMHTVRVVEIRLGLRNGFGSEEMRPGRRFV